MFSRPLWAEIDLAALKHNVRQIKNMVHGRSKIMAVVKGDAYGHGAVQVVKSLQEEGITAFSVALLQEAKSLRKSGIKDQILILGWTPAEDFEEAVDYDLTLCIYDLDEARLLSRIASEKKKTVTIHLKIDTGMTRLGFLPGDKSAEEIKKIMGLPGLRIEGIFTHLSKADQKNKEYSRLQLKKFSEFTDQIEENTGYKIPVRHAANSASIISFPVSYFDMVRAGIILYGLRPSAELDFEKFDFKPVLSLKARLSRVETIPVDTLVSYGGTFKTDHQTKIGTIPAGYADGYTRLLSGKGEVVIRGQKRPVVGAICMDQCMMIADGIDGVEKGEEIFLIGGDSEQETADDIAKKIGTINYEVICMISARVPRKYV